MDLLKNTKDVCNKNNIVPSRSKGQNFLVNEDIYNEIVDSANLNKDDIVLEIGPGLGILTEKLAKKVKKVVAVELDDKLFKYLSAKIKTENIGNVELINADVIKIKVADYGLKTNDYKIVANLPYNITSIFLRNFLTINPPQSMVLMLQKEVAERIAAALPEMSILAISVQYYANPKILTLVAKDNFWPQPEIDSAIIKIDLKSEQDRGSVDKEKDFFRLVKIGFSSRRKMLKNNLMSGYKFSQEIANNKIKSAGLPEKVRAQELSLQDWQKLFVQFR